MNDNMDIPEFTRLDLGVIWRLDATLSNSVFGRGMAPVGGLGISGLESVEDHNLAVACLQRWCS